MNKLLVLLGLRAELDSPSIHRPDRWQLLSWLITFILIAVMIKLFY
jgi:hypothetical protein